MQAQQDAVILISGGGIDLGDALKEHIRSSITRAAGKYFDRLTRASTQFSREGLLYKCTLSMHMGALEPMVCVSEHKDIYTCFNQAMRSMTHQLQRHKEALREDKASRPDKTVTDTGESTLAVSQTRSTLRKGVEVNRMLDEAAE